MPMRNVSSFSDAIEGRWFRLSRITPTRRFWRGDTGTRLRSGGVAGTRRRAMLDWHRPLTVDPLYPACRPDG